MAIRQGTVSVTTSATLLNTFPDTDGVFGNSVAVNNGSAVTVYLGGSDVTTANGYPLAAATNIAIDVKPGDALYGIVATSTATVNVLAEGV